jgi:hypothetical protein
MGLHSRSSIVAAVPAAFVLVAALLTGTVPAQASTRTPFPLGTMRDIGGEVHECPDGFTCNNYIVENCPGISVDDALQLAETDPATRARGVVVFYDGGGGSKWWSQSESGDAFLAKLRDVDRFIVIQVRWRTIGWLDASDGLRVGPARMACRPATTVKWIHDNVYLPLGLHPAPGQCGFCITGNSGGASQVSYPLSHYGLAPLLDAVVPTGGPDHAAITKACLQVGPYGFNDAHRKTIDFSYGYFDPDHGPCFKKNRTGAPWWDPDSVDIGGSDYDYPSTRVELVIGGLDDTGAPAHAAAFRDRLLRDPSNSVTWTFIPDMPHHIEDNLEGQAAIEAAFLKTL